MLTQIKKSKWISYLKFYNWKPFNLIFSIKFKKPYLKYRISYKLIISSNCFASFIIYSPVFLIKEIDIKPGTHDQYQSEKTNFGASFVGNVTLIILSFIRITLAIGVLSVLNVITAFKLKSHLKKKMISNVISNLRNIKGASEYSKFYQTLPKIQRIYPLLNKGFP